MKTTHTILICILFGSCVGAVWDSETVKRVRTGVQFFRSGQYTEAATAFAEAQATHSDNATIAFDQACTLSAQGEFEQAKELFQEASLAPEPTLSAHSHYNLGNLAAAKAQESLAADPVSIDPQKRPEVIAGLLSAVGHYRDALRADSAHPDARHNLELIRLFIKHIQAEWEKRDREKAREDLGLLEFLEMIDQKQQTLRMVAGTLAQQDDSPQRRQFLRETADSQRQLQEEIDPLKQKIATEVANAAEQQPAADADQQKQIQMMLEQLADDAGRDMLRAADQIQTAQLESARESQLETLDQLNETFMIVAPFASILQRSIPVQERLIAKSERLAESLNADDPGNSVPATLESQDNVLEDLSIEQSRITDWAKLLGLKAEAELPSVEAGIESADSSAADAAPDAPQDPDEKTEEVSPDDPSAQLKSLAKAMKKAVELAPKVEELSASAESHLKSDSPGSAVPDQQEALRLLQEIAKPLSNQDNDKNHDQGNEDDNQQTDQNQEQQDQSQEDGQPDSDKRQKQEQKSSLDQAESVMRRAREREREHREREKELRRILGGLVPVDKDW